MRSSIWCIYLVDFYNIITFMAALKIIFPVKWKLFFINWHVDCITVWNYCFANEKHHDRFHRFTCIDIWQTEWPARERSCRGSISRLGAKVVFWGFRSGAGIFLVAAVLFTRCHAASWLRVKMNLSNPVVVWVGAFLLSLLFFYGMDHFIMSIQGLPLNFDLTPMQWNILWKIGRASCRERV